MPTSLRLKPLGVAGDFTANGVIDGIDFLEWNANKFTSSDTANLATFVPTLDLRAKVTANDPAAVRPISTLDELPLATVDALVSRDSVQHHATIGQSVVRYDAAIRDENADVELDSASGEWSDDAVDNVFSELASSV